MSARPGTSGELPAERQKLKSAEVQRSPDFWFKKGDFVLVASQKVAYRLHGDVLARQSKVFSDLLNLEEAPRPDLDDTMDGCPIIHVTDSPEDFSTFLGLLYDGFKHHRLHAQNPRWTSVRVMTVLGDKYDVPELREEGLRQLHVWYAAHTEDIEGWDKRDRELFARETDHLSVASVTRTLQDLFLHASVLYHCCRLAPSCLVAGDPDTGSPPLSLDDLVRTLACIKGMPQRYLNLLVGLSNILCKTLAACTECCRVSRAVQTVFDETAKTDVGRNAYRFLDLCAWSALSDAVKAIVCETCFQRYISSLRQNRQLRKKTLVVDLELMTHFDFALSWLQAPS